MKSLRCGVARCVAGLLAFAASVPIAAQESGIPRDRTGPDATPAPLPDYATPPSDALVPTVTAQDASVSRSGLGGAFITSVDIAPTGSGDSAVPPERWSPPEADAAGLQLTHTPGQALDAQWVRSQFDGLLAAGNLRASSALAAVQLINRAYITAGFINSGLLVLPESDLASGALRLRLVFGELAASNADPITVEWSGHRNGLSDNYIRARFPSAQAQPFNALDLERDFRLLTEDQMVRTVSAALQPGSQPGQAGLKVLIDPVDRFEVYGGAANDRSPSVGGERGFIGGAIRNALFSGDTVSAEFGMTKGAEDGQLAYSTPFLSRGTSVFARAEFSNAAVIDRPLEPLDIKAKDRSAELGFVQTLFRTPLMPGLLTGTWASSQDLSVGASVFHRRQKSYLLGEPFSFAPGARDGRTEYSALRLTADYVRRNTDHVIGVSISGTLGLGGTQSDIPAVPNPGDHFTALRGQVSAAKRIGSGLELRGRLIAQYAGGTLYSGERLGVGGIDSVRGYRESLYLADRGVTGSAELAYPFSLSKPRANGVSWGSFTAVLFADAAKFGNVEKPRIQRDFISSVGASLAWTPTDAFRATVTYGKALQDVTGSGQDDLQDHGLHFAVIVRPVGLFGGSRNSR